MWKNAICEKNLSEFFLTSTEGYFLSVMQWKKLCVKKNSFNIKVFQLCYYVQKNRHDWIIYASFRYPNTISSRILHSEFHYYETIFSHSSWYFLRDFKCHASTTFSYTFCKFAVSRIQFTISYFFGASTTRVVTAERYTRLHDEELIQLITISHILLSFSQLSHLIHRKNICFIFHTSAFLSILTRIRLAILK